MYHIFLSRSSADGHLGWPRFLTTVHRAAVNVNEQASLWWHVESFGQIPRRGIVGSYGHSIFNF